MKAEVEQLEKNKVMLKVEVPAEHFDEIINRAFKDVAGKISIPGFRKGKIPRAIVEQRVGIDYVIQEALSDSLPVFYVQAVSETKITPVDQPEVNVEQAEEHKPLVFTAKVNVKPEVDLPDYEGMEIERPYDEVTDKEIDHHLAQMRDSFATLEEAGTDTVEKGEYALIDFEGTVDDEEIEGGSAEDYLLEVGSGSFVPGVEDRMIGMKKGETKEIWVDIPEDYQSKVIAGKRVKFVVNVKDIKNKKLPELDDDLAKNVGFDTLEEYMEDARKRMGGLKKSQIDAAVRDQIIKKVTRAAKVDVPTVMTEQKLDSMIVDFGRNLEGKGITLGQYFEASGKTLEDLRETLREEAVYQVKSDLVLEAVAKAEGLEPEEQEVDMEISALATVLDKTPEETRKMLMANGRINFVVERVMVRKTVDRLLEKAEIKAKPAPESDETAAKPAGKKASKAVPAAGKRAKKAKTEEAGETSEKPAANEKRDEE